MRQFLGDCVLMLGSHGLRLAGLVVCQALLIRLAGTTAFAHFSYLVGIFTLLGVVSDLGIGPTAAKEVAEAEDASQERRCTAAMRRMMLLPICFFCLAATLSVLASAAFIAPQLWWPGIVGALAGFGFALQVPLRDLLSGKKDIFGFAVMNSAPFVLGAAIMVVAAAFSALDLQTAMNTIALTHSLTAVLLLWRCGGLARARTAAVDRFRAARREYGWGISLGRIVGTGAFLLDVPILGFFWTPTHLAAYAALKTISQPLSVAGSIVSRVVFKRLVSLPRIPLRFQLLNGAFALAAGCCLMAGGYSALRLVYDIDPAPLQMALMAQCVAVMAHAVYSLYNSWLHAQGHGRLLGFGGVAFGVLCVLANFLLIPWRGAAGACLANVVCNVSWLVFCLICHYRCAAAADEPQRGEGVQAYPTEKATSEGLAA